MFNDLHKPILNYNILIGNLFIFIFLLGFTPVQGQFWVKKQYGPNVDETLAVTGDESGNTYTTGYFSSTANINGETKTVVGVTDVYISKISATGNTEWVATAGGLGSDRGLSIAVDFNSNVIVSGFYTGSIHFGNGIELQSVNGSQDAFVAKYNSQGQIMWAKSGGSAGNSDRANGVAVDNSGNVYITGQFSGSANFGDFTLESLNGSIDVFIVKYDADGNELWAKKGSGTATDRGFAITTDNQQGVYVTGQFSNDITFDNTHSNNILNAVFIIKLSSSGHEEWFRYAGGSEQSIAHGITSNGSEVYVTGDFGNSITFLGSGTSALSSSFSNSIFIAAYSSSGNLLWKKSQGSSSAVSARDIACRDNQLAIVGWHECTFNSLSEIYGEAMFNSMGYKDIFVMRYNTSGEFIYARNFGSPREEVATGVHIQTDGKEVITGVFREALFIPLGSTPVNGISSTLPVIFNGTYCGDPNYGKFGTLASAPNHAEDGFVMKAIDPTRSPMDIYKRIGSACDLSIPETCISALPSYSADMCDDEISFCPGNKIFAHNFIPTNSDFGYHSNYVWSPGGSTTNNSLTVNASGTYNVTITSKDGCYTSTASAIVNVHPVPIIPFLSDNAGVNTHTQNPGVIELCDGESVKIWADFPNTYSYTWTGPGIIDSGQSHSDTIHVSQSGLYSLIVENPEGCTKAIAVFVTVHTEPPVIQPYVQFTPNFNDSLSLCQGDNIMASVKDSLTDGLVPTSYSIKWQFSPNVSIIPANPAHFTFLHGGWHYYTILIKSKQNPCSDIEMQHIISDSIYVHPKPEVSFHITGNPSACPGDTVTLYYTYSGGNPTFDFEPLELFEDSMYVLGPGNYLGSVTATNEFGCSNTAYYTASVVPATTPSITALPASGLLCPGDSIALVLNSPGVPYWQGPDGLLGSTQEIYVHQAGLYFAEVAISSTCVLVSNTLLITEYSTPFINGNGGILCDENDSLEIFINTNIETEITWLPPLSGNDSVQVVTAPGVYSAYVSSCGVSTQVSIEVELNTNAVTIFQPDTTPVCMGDSIFIRTDSSFSQYEWTTGEVSSGINVYNSGNYQVEVLDEYGCKLFSNLLEVEFEPLPESVIFQANPVCAGETQVINAINPYSVTYTHGINGDIIQTGPVFIIPEFFGDTTLYAYATSNHCIGPIDSLKISAKPFPDEPILESNAPVCIGTSVNLKVFNAEAGVQYSWVTPSGNVFMGSNIHYETSSLSDEGWYESSARLNGCTSDTVAIYIPLFPTRFVELPPDTALCLKSGFKIFPSDEFEAYIWQDGSTNSWFEPKSSSDISLSVWDENGCESHASMYIEMVDCSIKVPNVFTPNGDGFNDMWIVTTGDPVSYKLVVYNRWGRIVFESGSVNHFWDGSHYKTGEPCSEGVYFYILEINNFEGTPIEQTGTVTLIRS